MRWNEHRWKSCFGAMCYINYEYLNYINNKYNITNLIDVVHNRSDRCTLERIFGIIFSFETKKRHILLGNINTYLPNISDCSYKYDDYIELFNKKKIIAPVVKVWTGR